MNDATFKNVKIFLNLLILTCFPIGAQWFPLNNIKHIVRMIGAVY